MDQITTPQPNRKSSAPYLLGLLCLIPLIGAFVGLGLLLYALIKYKDKWLAIIGVAGILWTIVFYSLLFYVGKKFAERPPILKSLAAINLRDAVKDIEFYNLQFGHYPDSLQQLRVVDSFAMINDPGQMMQGRKHTILNYIRSGNVYTLFSSGPDGVAGTADDIYPEIVIHDTNRIGLRKWK